MSAAPIPPPWSHLEARWLAEAGLGATRGAVVELVVPPGGGYETHRLLGCERVFYLYRGSGLHLGSGGPLEVEADEVLVLDPEAWHGFANRGDTDAVIWLAWAPAPTFEAANYEALGDADAGSAPGPARRKLREGVEDPQTTTAERGFRDVGVIWDGAEGASSITLGWGHFERRALHRMHRHAFADEAMFVESGVGFHVVPGAELEMKGPAHAFVAAGEWHSMEVREGRVEGMFFYLGANDLETSGYELESEPTGPSGTGA